MCFPGMVPHSCGEICGKDRGCPHPCPMPCHPGPCEPCTAVTVAKDCYCGKTTLNLPCGLSKKGHACGQMCGKTLSCGIHQCYLNCHDGPCSKCEITNVVSCYCGKDEKEVPCGQNGWSCKEVCGKVLDCGHHTCQRPCHDGPCDPCEFTPAKWGLKCACGQSEQNAALITSIRTSCSQPLWLCKKQCGKILPCGRRNNIF